MSSMAQTNELMIEDQFKDQSLKSVLQTLEEKYALFFAYDEAAINGWQVNETFTQVPLSKALKKILAPTGLDFQMHSAHKILIAPRSESKEESILGEMISGEVLDAESGAPLPFATVYYGSNKGVTTNEKGIFNIPSHHLTDTLKIKIQFLGYQSRQMEMPIGQNKPPKIKVELSPKIHAFEQITILDRIPIFVSQKTTNASVLSTASGSRLPGFIGGTDLMRSLQLLPGIAANNDLSADIQIRGAESDENLILLDGMTLFNPGHFFGIFSSINPNIINKVSVYKNAFPIEYGAYTAGVIEMESNQLKRQKVQAGIELNLLTSNAFIHSPISKNMDILIAGRVTNQNLGNTSYFNLLNKDRTSLNTTLEPEENLSRDQLISVRPDFRFHDLNAKWTWRPTAKTSIDANFFRSYDSYDYNYENSFTNRFLINIEVKNEETFSETNFWNNNAYSLNLNHRWNKNFKSKITLSHTNYQSEGGTKTSLTRSTDNFTNTKALENKEFNTLKNYNFNWKNTWTLNHHHQLTFGYQREQNNLNLSFDVQDSTVVDLADQGLYQALYLEHQLKSNGFSLKTGLRNTYYRETAQFYFSPRIQLNYQFDPQWNLKASYSLQNQFLQQVSYENRFGRKSNYWILADDRRRFPVAGSTHLMLGFNHKKTDFEWDVELFYNFTDGVIEQSLAIPGFDENRMINAAASRFIRYNGNRKTIGLDLLLKKEWNNYTSWLAYTLSKTTSKYPRINNGNPIPSDNDRRHQLKWLHLYKHKKWDFSATYVFTSGLTYTDLNKITDQNLNREDLTPTDFLSRLPDYHRFDIGTDYNFKIKSLDARIGLSVFNLFNVKNVKFTQYIFSIDTAQNALQRLNV